MVVPLPPIPSSTPSSSTLSPFPNPTTRASLAEAWLIAHYRTLLNVSHNRKGGVVVLHQCGVLGCEVRLPSNPEGAYEHWVLLHPEWVDTRPVALARGEAGNGELGPALGSVVATRQECDYHYNYAQHQIRDETQRELTSHEKLLMEFYAQQEKGAREAAEMQEQYRKQWEWEAERRWERDCTEWEVMVEKERAEREREVLGDRSVN